MILHFIILNLTINRRNSFFLSPSTTTLGKRKLIRVVESKIPKVTFLSISKTDCQNYLFEDYSLKSYIEE